MDQFFAKAQKPVVPAKRKAKVSVDEDFLVDAAEQASGPPLKKAATQSSNTPRQPATRKTRKPVTKKVKALLPSLENATLNKPEAWGKPPVWAEKRQQLCSSVPYHRGYESAAYRSNNMIAGFLVNQGVGLRDVFTEDIYITKV